MVRIKTRGKGEGEAVHIMKIGLIDVDGHNFPNLPLMKLSAWHKSQGDTVEWYQPLIHNELNCNPFDKVYMSKVFTFTPDYQYPVNAVEVIKGGTGYYYPDGGEKLPVEIEHIYPDYDLYGITNTAYGFLTRGCPYGKLHKYCIVGEKEGLCSVKVADLSEFWNGQKNIVLLDPNITACKDCHSLFKQLIDSKAWVYFSQGLDMSLMTPDKAELLKQIKVKQVHFAMDRYEEMDRLIPKFKEFKEITRWDKRKMGVYVLVNFDTTHEQDLERIYKLKELGYWPYVMVYEREKLPKKHITRRLQRWVNMRAVFESIPRFEDYTG